MHSFQSFSYFLSYNISAIENISFLVTGINHKSNATQSLALLETNGFLTISEQNPGSKRQFIKLVVEHICLFLDQDLDHLRPGT